MNKMTLKKLSLLACAVTSLVTVVVAQTNQTDKIETKEQRDARMAWWREAKFGMFIHWGVFPCPPVFIATSPSPAVANGL